MLGMRSLNILQVDDILKETNKNLSDTELVTKTGKFKRVWEYMNIVNKTIWNLQELSNKEYKEMVDSKMYNSEYLITARKDKDDDIKDIVKGYKNDCTFLINETLDRARNQYAKMVSTSPTNEQLALLQAVSMRKSFTDKEINNISKSFLNNYQALQTFKDILETKGYRVVLPSSYNAQDIEDSLNYAKDYLTKRCNELGEDRKKCDFNNHSFYWKADQYWEDPNYTENVVNVLDTNIQTLPRVDILSLNDLSKEDRDLLDSVLNETDLTSIKDKIDDLEVNNKYEVLDVLRQHPDYANYFNGGNDDGGNKE